MFVLLLLTATKINHLTLSECKSLGIGGLTRETSEAHYAEAAKSIWLGVLWRHISGSFTAYEDSRGQWQCQYVSAHTLRGFSSLATITPQAWRTLLVSCGRHREKKRPRQRQGDNVESNTKCNEIHSLWGSLVPRKWTTTDNDKNNYKSPCSYFCGLAAWQW